MKKEYTVIINAPIDKAFAAVDDESNIKKWMGGDITTTYLNLKDRENPVGTKFQQKIAGISALGGEGEIIAYDKPRLLGVGTNSALAKATFFYNFEQLNENSTKLTCALEIATPNTFKEKTIAMLMPIINKLMNKQLNTLKKLAEGQ